MAESKREILKKKILDAAEKRIESQGLAALRARDITKDARCALGSLYNAFEDLDLLILAVNSRTLARLHASLQNAPASQEAPKAKLLALALAYLNFGTENRNLWAALLMAASTLPARSSRASHDNSERCLQSFIKS